MKKIIVLTMILTLFLSVSLNVKALTYNSNDTVIASQTIALSSYHNNYFTTSNMQAIANGTTLTGVSLIDDVYYNFEAYGTYVYAQTDQEVYQYKTNSYTPSGSSRSFYVYKNEDLTGPYVIIGWSLARGYFLANYTGRQQVLTTYKAQDYIAVKFYNDGQNETIQSEPVLKNTEYTPIEMTKTGYNFYGYYVIYDTGQRDFVFKGFPLEVGETSMTMYPLFSPQQYAYDNSASLINDIFENGLQGYYVTDDNGNPLFMIYTENTYDYGVGFAEAQLLDDFNLWGVAFGALMLPFQLLSIELMPGIYIGYFVLIPIVFGLIALFFSFRGGKKQ